MTGGLLPVSSPWWQGPWVSRPAIFFQLNTCFHSPYVTSSLMRGWVCCLQLLLALASAVIFRSESRGLMTTFCCLKFETPQTWRIRFPYLYPPGTGWPSYTPQALGSLFITSYNSQGYNGGIRPCIHMGSQWLTKSRSQVRLRLMVYHQSSSWCQAPWDSRPETFFSAEPLW
jgi:hypothetical protein